MVMSERSIESLYEQVRALVPAQVCDAPPHVVPVAPGIRVVALRSPTLPPAAHTNGYLIGPEGGPLVVVDPGSPFEDQQAALDDLLGEVPIAMIALTHHHGDHVGGATALAARTGAPIAAHPATAERLDGVVSVSQLVADGDVVHGLTAVHTPGHAAGHLCFEYGRATIAGDLVAGLGTILIDPDEGDMAAYLASLERLLARDGAASGRGSTTLLPAHGPPIADGAGKLREYLAHRRMREERVLGALAARPSTLAELLAVAYGDTPTALWPLAERSLLAHLIKLAREGRAHSDGSGAWSRL